jgi:TonB family protein
MIAAWMVYTMVVSVALSCAAWVADGLASRRAVSRWIWAGALGASAILPVVRVLAPAGGGGEGALDPASGPVVFLAPLTVGLADVSVLQLLNGPLTALWVLASATLGGWALHSWLRLRRVRRQCKTVLRDGEEVLVSEGVGPAVVGFRKPAILLPSWSLDSPDIDAIFAHEREHLQAGDGRLLAALWSIVVLFPWNPVFWWMRRRAHLAVEADCDARVIRDHPVRLRRYCELLYEVGARSLTPVPVSGVALSERPSMLERRIRRLLDARRDVTPLGVIAVAAVVGAAVSAAFLVPDSGFRQVGSVVPGPAHPGADPTPAPVEPPPQPPSIREAPPSPDPGTTPTFTPYTVAPELLNRAEVVEALRSEYPPLLREAGIGGAVNMWFFIDEAGTVKVVRVQESSGHQPLDQAAVRVGRVMRFSPALNRDAPTAVWVAFPITFSPS